jgi:hypothetical protein
MAYTDLTLKKLFGLTGNKCAFPDCDLPILDTEHGVLIGQICHIKGKSPHGPRYDREQTEAERNGYENLLVMCASHNKIVDDEATRDQFPVQLLTEFKKAHEARNQNTLVSEDLIDKVARLLDTLQPRPAPGGVVSTVESFRVIAKDNTELDKYLLAIKIRNESEIIVRAFCVDAELPMRYLPEVGTISEVEAGTPENRRFRRSVEGMDYSPIYCGDTCDAFSIFITIQHPWHHTTIDGSLRIFVYVQDKLTSNAEYPIVQLLETVGLFQLYD